MLYALMIPFYLQKPNEVSFLSLFFAYKEIGAQVG